MTKYGSKVRRMYASTVLIELMLPVTAIVNVGTNRLVGCKLKWEAIAAFFRGGHSNIQAVVDEADAMMYQNKKKLQSSAGKKSFL